MESENLISAAGCWPRGHKMLMSQAKERLPLSRGSKLAMREVAFELDLTILEEFAGEVRERLHLQRGHQYRQRHRGMEHVEFGEHTRCLQENKHKAWLERKTAVIP